MSQVLGWGILPASVQTSTETNDSQNSHLSSNFVGAPDAASYYSANNENDLLHNNNAKNNQSLFQNQQYGYPQQPKGTQNGYSNKTMDKNYVIGQQAPQAGWTGFGYGQQINQQMMPPQANYLDGSYDQQSMQYQQNVANQQQFMAAAQQQNLQTSQEIDSAKSDKARDAAERPLVRLSVNLIHTYKNINEVINLFNVNLIFIEY